MGKPFRPTRSWTGMFFVSWTFGDIYNTLFHPSIGEVLAQAHDRSGWRSVVGTDPVSIYLKMFRRVEPNSTMEVFLFIDDETLTEVYIFKSFQDLGGHSWGGVALYDPERGTMYQEPMLCAMHACPFLMDWAMGKEKQRDDSNLDLSRCTRA